MSLAYSRENPSPEYLRLAALYKDHHNSSDNENWAKDVYPGKSLWPHIGFIKAAIERHGAKTLLDYGAGKGMQYTNMRVKVAKVIIEDDVWIGAKSTILCGVKIGKGSIVAANSVVNKDVEEFTVVGGVPAKPIKKR